MASEDKTKKSLFKISYTLRPAKGRTSILGTLFESKEKYLSISLPPKNKSELIFNSNRLYLKSLVFPLDNLNSSMIFNFPSLSFLK